MIFLILFLFVIYTRELPCESFLLEHPFPHMQTTEAFRHDASRAFNDADHALTIFVLWCSQSAVKVYIARMQATNNSETRGAPAFDFLVAGAGMAGICAAIQAARLGLRVVLVEKEMFLGGNAGPNLGVGSLGAQHGNPFWNETGIIEEIEERAAWFQWRTAPGLLTCNNTSPLWDTMVAALLRDAGVVILRKHLVLNTQVRRGAIRSVTLLNIENLAHSEVRIDGFVVDATGDAHVAALTGAECRMGREGRAETGERSAPDAPDAVISAASVTALTVDVGVDVPFSPPPGTPVWNPEKPANTFHPSRRINVLFQVDEGGEDERSHPLLSPQALHEKLVRRIYSIWDYFKNTLYPDAARTHQLIWISPILGRRESRRVIGNHILTQTDIEAGRRFSDAVAFGGFPLDFHPPSADGGYECIYFAAPLPFDIPLRCLYSRNVRNLFAAGRNISATHLAFASIRVQRTGGAIGQAVAAVAAHCRENGKMPGNLTQADVKAIQQSLLREDVFLPGIRNEDAHDLAHRAHVTASSEAATSLPAAFEPHPAGAWRGAAEGMGVALYVYPPAVQQAAFFVRNPHDRQVMATASLVFGATPSPQHLCPEWPRTQPYQFRHPGRIEHPHFTEALETVALAVPAGFHGWLDVKFRGAAPLPPPGREVFARALLLGIEGEVDVFCLPPWLDILDAYRKIPGTGWQVAGGSDPATPAFRLDPDPVPGRAANVLDGFGHREGIGLPHQWTSAPGQPLPQWLELAFAEDVQLDLVQLRFDSTERYGKDMPWEKGQQTASRLVADYTLEAYAGGQWVTLADEHDNFLRFRAHRLAAPMTTRRLRLTVNRVWGDGEPARVYEIRIYQTT